MADLTIRKSQKVKNVKPEKSASYVGTYDSKNKEITFTVSSSPAEKCFRLVHDGEKIILYEENGGITDTGMTMFCGSKEECDAEIGKLGLKQENHDNIIDLLGDSIFRGHAL